MGVPTVPELIGGAQLCNLVLSASTSTALQFSGQMWADSRESVAIPITDIRSEVRHGDEVVLDIGAHVDTTDNSFVVNVPGVLIGALDPKWDNECRWFFEVVGGEDGEVEIVTMTGIARVV